MKSAALIVPDCKYSVVLVGVGSVSNRWIQTCKSFLAWLLAKHTQYSPSVKPTYTDEEYV